MKKLEELKISPTPWKCATNDCGEFVGILNGRGFYVAKFAYDITPNDARFIASAPEVYKRSYELIEAFDRRELTPIHIDALRAALRKASGESEVK